MYFSFENVEYVNTAVVLLSINTAFERFGIINFKKSLLGLNCVGAFVIISAYVSLGALIKENNPWLEPVYCSNNRNDLALKGTFENCMFFKK